MGEKPEIIKLEKHSTKDVKDSHINGSLTLIWRDYDKIIKNHPKMVYVSSVESGEIKGPHLHKRRNSYFTCIHGKVIFIIKTDDGFEEIESDAENPVMIFVPKNSSSAHINISNSTSRILTLTDVAWRPNDDEMENVEFSDYDWSKWKKSF
jgi:dTDP-4-dehydrorhamnose 3,5-epimerase